jgi:peptidoglycan/LPS O-acetylase OafA/YrhL
LDGLRAISIVLVLFGHVTKTANYLEPLQAFGALAGFGVRVFFVISGFLISTLLFRELEKSTTIALTKFYFRRCFRIFPAFYVYVAVIVALAASHAIELRKGDIIHAVTYTTNYHYDRSWYLGHLWSLSVEEQFYLLWPATVLVVGRVSALRVAGVFVLAAPLVRAATLRFHWTPEAGIGESFQSVGDAIATGCLFAGFRERLEQSTKYLSFLHSRVFVVVPLAALACVFGRRVAFDFLIGQTVENVAVALVVHWALLNEGGRTGRLLNSPTVSFVGTLSYSVYLWQQLFTHTVSGACWTVFPVNLACLSAAALTSYYLVERPFLRWRERLERILFAEPASQARAEKEH